MSPPARTDGAPVLIVEDDRDIRELLGAFFEMRGCSVILAADGQQALDELARADPLPCFILLDFRMPRIDAFAFRAVQERDPRLAAIPVVLCSAAPELRETAAQLGAAAWLKKPFEPEDLLGVLRRFRASGCEP